MQVGFSNAPCGDEESWNSCKRDSRNVIWLSWLDFLSTNNWLQKKIFQLINWIWRGFVLRSGDNWIFRQSLSVLPHGAVLNAACVYVLDSCRWYENVMTLWSRGMRRCILLFFSRDWLEVLATQCFFFQISDLFQPTEALGCQRLNCFFSFSTVASGWFLDRLKPDHVQDRVSRPFDI